MSMNLCFNVKKCKTCGHFGHVEFPFQTSTYLTYAVLALKTIEERLALIRLTITNYGWDKEDIEKYMCEIEALMTSPTLELGMI